MKRVVIDANIGISFILPLPYSSQAIEQMARWRTERAQIIVPALWRYEVLTGLRKAISGGFIPFDEAVKALQALQDMAFEEHPITPGEEIAILLWAERIGQPVVYDSAYLELCERIEAEFWTADKRLADAAQRAGADWVHRIVMD